MLYESLRASLHEICAMLLVRGFIDAQRVSAVLLQHGPANCTGVRPGEEVVVSDQAALDWLDANISTRSRDAVNQAGERPSAGRLFRQENSRSSPAPARPSVSLPSRTRTPSPSPRRYQLSYFYLVP